MVLTIVILTKSSYITCKTYKSYIIQGGRGHIARPLASLGPLEEPPVSGAPR